MLVYFDKNKKSYQQPIDKPFATDDLEKWLNEFCTLKLGIDYDVDENGIIDLRQTPEYKQKELEKAKSDKHAENTAKAKLAIENGYVEYKDAEFETNAQTVGDLTATMLLMQAGGIESYTWLSKDDKEVELTVEDFGILGGLIADFKGNIWQNKYLYFKNLIAAAQTAEDVRAIDINYSDI